MRVTIEIMRLLDVDNVQESLQQPGERGGSRRSVQSGQTEEDVPEESHLLRPGQCGVRGEPQPGGYHQVNLSRRPQRPEG